MSECINTINPTKTLFKDKVSVPAIVTPNKTFHNLCHLKPRLKSPSIRNIPSIYASSSTMSASESHRKPSPIDVLGHQGPRNEEILRAIKGSLSNCLSETNLHLTVPGLNSKTRGKGCDGSVLLNSTTQQAEKDAPPNLNLRGYQIIDKVKIALEKACPGVVSCADIVALVARDVVEATGGLGWDVETGRRDGRISLATEALANLPPPFLNIVALKASFQQKGLSVKDLVVLSGGHTIGVSHCSSFSNRLYNFSGMGNGDSDPTMDSNYVAKLRRKCLPNGPNNIVALDPGSSLTFDLQYYDLVSKRRGLLQSDAALLDDPETRAYVQTHKGGNPDSFFQDFAVSMINMGRIEVLTGNSGEIRKVCSRVN